MKLGGFSGIVGSMFDDKMDINRYQDTLNDDGTTDTKMSETPIHKNISCRVSFSTDESPRDSQVDDVPIKNVPKIFCGLNVDIRAGDFVTVRRFGDDGSVIATYSGKVGLPSVFATHKEALFSIERSA